MRALASRFALLVVVRDAVLVLVLLWVTEVALALGNAPRLLRRWLTGSLLATAASALPLAASASRQ